MKVRRCSCLAFKRTNAFALTAFVLNAEISGRRLDLDLARMNVRIRNGEANLVKLNFDRLAAGLDWAGVHLNVKCFWLHLNPEWTAATLDRLWLHADLRLAVLNRLVLEVVAIKTDVERRKLDLLVLALDRATTHVRAIVGLRALAGPRKGTRRRGLRGRAGRARRPAKVF